MTRRLRRNSMGTAAALALAVALACVVTGFARGASVSAKHGANVVVIKWLTHNPAESAAAEKTAQQLVEKFNATHPNIRVERESISRDELNTVIKTRLQSDAAPDIFQWGTGPAFSGVLQHAGLLRSLDPYYAKYKWNIYPWARKQLIYGGKTFGIPDQIETLGIYYNKDMFASLGLTPPKTTTQLAAACQKIKAAGKICLDFANKDQWPGASMFSMLSVQVLGRQNLDKILHGNGSWNTPGIVKGLNTVFVDFNKQGFYPPSLNGIAYDDANALFYAGKAAMLPTGTWLTAEILPSVKFKVGFIPFPSTSSRPPALASGIGDGWYISSKSKHPDEAAEFLNFWFSQSTGRTQLRVFNTVPAFPVNTSGMTLPPLFKQIVGLIKSGQATAGYNLDTLTPDKFNQEMYTGLQEVLGGSRSPQQEASALQRVWLKAKSGK
jgi:raffinose/stachyose/melibiose transport system substrate-binding protein